MAGLPPTDDDLLQMMRVAVKQELQTFRTELIQDLNVGERPVLESPLQFGKAQSCRPSEGPADFGFRPSEVAAGRFSVNSDGNDFFPMGKTRSTFVRGYKSRVLLNKAKDNDQYRPVSPVGKTVSTVRESSASNAGEDDEERETRFSTNSAEIQIRAASKEISRDGTKESSCFGSEAHSEVRSSAYGNRRSTIQRVMSTVDAAAKGVHKFRGSQVEHAFGAFYAPGSSSARLSGFERTESGKYKSRSLKSFLKQLLDNRYFEIMTLWLIIGNVVVCGYQIEQMARDGLKTTPAEYRVVDMAFCVYFAVEIFLRYLINRGRFYSMRGWAWNAFDTALAIIQIAEEILVGLSEAGLSGSFRDLQLGVGFFRTVRVLRVLHIIKFQHDLQLLASIVMASWQPFVWAMVFLLLMIYTGSIYVTQIVHSVLMDSTDMDPVIEQDLRIHFGSVTYSMLSLFKALTGGVDWGDLAQPLIDGISPAMGLGLVFYIAFSIFSVLNIVTGTFVAEAISRAKEVRMLFSASQAHRLFRTLDVQDSGFIAFEDIEKHLEDDDVQDYFETIDVDPSEAKCLFEILDIDGSGQIELSEFLEGVLRLQEPARALDVMINMRDNRIALERKLYFTEKKMALGFESIAEARGDKLDDLPRPQLRTSATGQDFAGSMNSMDYAGSSEAETQRYRRDSTSRNDS